MAVGDFMVPTEWAVYLSISFNTIYWLYLLMLRYCYRYKFIYLFIFISTA